MKGFKTAVLINLFGICLFRSLLWAACGLKQTVSPPSFPIAGYRFVFVVDTSGSMMGLGDGKAVIFPKVQAEIVRFLRNLPPSEVVIVPFHQGPQEERSFHLPEETEEAVAYVQGLKASGRNTWIYRTLISVLEKAPLKEGLATIYYLFTDGVDNDHRGPYRMKDVVQALKLRQGPYDWLYYIALGVSVPEEVRQGLASVPRTLIQEAGLRQVPILGAYTFKPAVLFLGNFLQEPEAQVEVALEPQGQPNPLRVYLDDESLQEQGAFLEVSPVVLGGGTHRLTFRLRGRKLQEGEYTAWLCFQSAEGTLVRPEAVQVRFAHHPPATYSLVSEGAPQRLRLQRGESAVLFFRLEGNTWARDPMRVSVNTPKGLQAFLNGEKGPIALTPGGRLELRLVNQSLAPGKQGKPTFQAEVSPGSQLTPLPALPSVVQPKTFWERVRDFWWLLPALLPFLIWWRRKHKAWGKAIYFPYPGDEERFFYLRGRYNLGRVDKRLENVFVERKHGVVILDKPRWLDAKTKEGNRYVDRNTGESFRFGTKVYFFSNKSSEPIAAVIFEELGGTPHGSKKA